MEEEQKKEPKPRGGFREGAGRKPYDGEGHPTMMVSVKLRRDFVDIIDHYTVEGSRSAFIQKAVKDLLKREGLI